MPNGDSRIEELEQEAARAAVIVVDSPTEIGATVRRVLAEHGLL